MYKDNLGTHLRRPTICERTVWVISIMPKDPEISVGIQMGKAPFGFF